MIQQTWPDSEGVSSRFLLELILARSQRDEVAVSGNEVNDFVGRLLDEDLKPAEPRTTSPLSPPTALFTFSSLC